MLIRWSTTRQSLHRQKVCWPVSRRVHITLPSLPWLPTLPSLWYLPSLPSLPSLSNHQASVESAEADWKVKLEASTKVGLVVIVIMVSLLFHWFSSSRPLSLFVIIMIPGADWGSRSGLAARREGGGARAGSRSNWGGWWSSWPYRDYEIFLAPYRSSNVYPGLIHTRRRPRFQIFQIWSNSAYIQTLTTFTFIQCSMHRTELTMQYFCMNYIDNACMYKFLQHCKRFFKFCIKPNIPTS